jgi:hypothetical protein
MIHQDSGDISVEGKTNQAISLKDNETKEKYKLILFDLGKDPEDFTIEEKLAYTE